MVVASSGPCTHGAVYATQHHGAGRIAAVQLQHVVKKFAVNDHLVAE
jgi:hypothetical protein